LKDEKVYIQVKNSSCTEEQKEQTRLATTNLTKVDSVAPYINQRA